VLQLRFKDLEGVWFNEHSVDQCELFNLRRLSLCGACCNEYDNVTERKKACKYGHDAVTCLCISSCFTTAKMRDECPSS